MKKSIITFENNQSDIKIKKFQIRKALKNALKAVVETEGVPFPVLVETVWVSKDEIAQTNNSFRQIDRPTDVLSFPLQSFNPSDAERFSSVPDWEFEASDKLTLGSIILCPEIAIEQAAQYGHPFEREYIYLTVHGLLHLLGYDHEVECDKVIMRKKEEIIMDKLGLSEKLYK
ncbi:MAG: rRNA maturation RNase YbeY [Clostridiales bacterium]|nr:rRNA maturation RNase YbeY [Clostridiales bacterium]